MSYKRFQTVADGIYKQTEACLSSLDQAGNGGKNPPAEIEELETALTKVCELSKTILDKAGQEDESETEPDEEQ